MRVDLVMQTHALQAQTRDTFHWTGSFVPGAAKIYFTTCIRTGDEHYPTIPISRGAR